MKTTAAIICIIFLSFEGFAQGGCTDSTACNYDSGAIEDDGSCAFNSYTLNFNWTDLCSHGEEPNWTLVDSGTGMEYASGSDSETNLCLDSACYTLVFNSPFGNCYSLEYALIETASSLELISGNVYQSSEVDIVVAGGNGCAYPGCTTFGACNYDPLANINDNSCEYASCVGCTDPEGCNYDFTATNSVPCDYSCHGCTDTEACNYSEFFTVEDGSCCYEHCLTVEMFDSFGDGWSGAEYEISNDMGIVVASGSLENADEGNGQSFGTDQLCLPEGCYYIFVSAGAHPEEVSWMLNGIWEGSVSGAVWEEVEFGLGIPCNHGCTSPEACNYDSSATDDDGSCCFDVCTKFQVVGGQLSNEIGWSVFSPGVNTETASPIFGGIGQLEIPQIYCLPVNCEYQVVMTDSFGDGWEGAYWSFFDAETGEIFSTGTLIDGSGPEIALASIGYSQGCTDSVAANYNSEAQCDDGSCIYCELGESLLVMNMTDSFSQDWNGTSYTISDDQGIAVFEGAIENADVAVGPNTAFDYLCLASGCWTVSVSNGNFPSEVGWSLSMFGEAPFLEGGAPFEDGAFSINSECDIPGCTNPDCFNFNPVATIDDGNCLCPQSQEQCDGAIPIECGESILGSTINGIPQNWFNGVICDYVIPESPGHWFSAIGDGQQLTFSTCNPGTGFNTQLFVFQSSAGCDGLDCLAESAGTCGGLAWGTEISINSEVGVEYYVLLTGYSGVEGLYEMSLNCLGCSVLETGQTCEDANVLTSAESFVSSICCAPPDSENPCSPNSTTSYGYWHCIYVDSCDNLTFELVNLTSSSLGMTVYSTGFGAEFCDEMTAVACCGPVEGTCAGDFSAITTLEKNQWVYIYVYTTDPENCGDYLLNVTCEYLGCTDPYACNFNPYATTFYLEDCDYISCSPPFNDIIQNAHALTCGELMEGTTGNSSANAPIFELGCSPIPGPGVWYSFTGTGEWHTLSTCGSATDTQVNIYTSDDNSPTGVLSCAVDSYTGLPLSDLGYDLSSNCDFFNQNDVLMEFQTEPDVNYFIYVSVEDPGEWGPHHILLECVPFMLGCMNDVACNYSVAATVDDFTCEYFSCACAPEAEMSSPILVAMHDDFGDGWNGGEYIISQDGTVLASGSLDSAQVIPISDWTGPIYGEDYLCLEAGCYDIEVTGGSFGGEISWEIFNAAGTELVSGGAPTVTSFCIELEGTFGCTDPLACNYNASMNFNDGSCVYPGCTNIEALNYDPTAGCDNGECEFNGDIDGDGSVGTGDLLDLLGNFGCVEPPDCPGDLNGDGIVNILDIMMLLGYF